MNAKRSINSKNTEPKNDSASARFGKSQLRRPSGLPFKNMFHLQQNIGNRAVQKLFKSGTLQAKLKIGKPNDVYEQEADRVAGRVMRMPDLAIGNQRPAIGRGNEPTIQQKPG